MIPTTMSAEQWARVCALFDELRAQAPAARDAALAAPGIDPAVGAEVAAMLRAYDHDPAFLEPSGAETDSLADALAGSLKGRRIGAYRLGNEIGRGGMGIVYEARRDDQEFDRRVAIKILPAWSAPTIVDRFRFERRVLAALDHPGIASLLDAGTSDDGVPYFVMEFVEGEPIDAWCESRNASLGERLALVERVCAALAYAHQHLVVHRDVKPANILVTRDGQPKLLDFGIATLLADGAAGDGRTRTGQHSFTPEYASPEQIRGERVTTASDVYSLGVVLYRLLAGTPPYSLAGLSPLDAMRTIAEVDPPPMSAAAEPGRGAALRGDLDRIVEKTLRKAPGSRYGTVAELAADLRAWREGRPISAVPHSMLYRLRRAAARNRGATVSVAAVTLALVAGGAATAWQARVAARERDKAQHRFREVRQFSRSLLFDVHDALRQVPGATEPRRLLLDRAVLLLQGLANDAGDDPELQLELAEGYRRLATVQGSAGADNVGDTAAALASFERAAHWIEEALRRSPGSREALSTAIDTYGGWASVAQDRGDQPVRDRADARRLGLIDELRRRHPDNEEAIADVASGYSDAGILRAGRRELPEARRFYVQAVDHYARLSPERRAGAAARAYSLTLKRLGAVEMVEDDLDASEAHYRNALAIEEAMNARPGEAGRWAYEITYTLSDLGLIASRRGRLDEALSLWARALEIRQAALSADPRNERVLTGVATLLGRLGYAYRERKAHDAAVEALDRQLALRETALAIPGAPPARRRERAATAIELAAALLDRAAGRPAGAAEDRRRARAVLQRVAADVEALTGAEGDALRATHREATARLGG